MQNTVMKQNKKNATMTFDLKGSMKNRKTKFPESDNRWWVPQKSKKIRGHKKCMMDKNFIEINKDFNQTLLNFSEERIEEYSKMIQADTYFLRKHNLMDYSLLLVVEFLDTNNLSPFQYLRESSRISQYIHNPNETKPIQHLQTGIKQIYSTTQIDDFSKRKHN